MGAKREMFTPDNPFMPSLRAINSAKNVNKTQLWIQCATCWTIYALDYTNFSPPYRQPDIATFQPQMQPDLMPGIGFQQASPFDLVQNQGGSASNEGKSYKMEIFILGNIHK